ncbi:MAG TPA: hypothetical protein VFF13_05320 [archaeon]|nr:hypothetical protein [archaeon]
MARKPIIKRIAIIPTVRKNPLGELVQGTEKNLKRAGFTGEIMKSPTKGQFVTRGRRSYTLDEKPFDKRIENWDSYEEKNRRRKVRRRS